MYRLLPRVVILAQGVFFFALNSNAQILDLPRESPKAQVSQRIGVTDIALQYSRPVVKGRKVWGAVVPLGDVWRAGANENTTIEFSDAVTVEGKPLPKGVYGLHMIPKENEWTVIFSKNSTSWGSYTYNPAEDALRVTVNPQPAEFREALTYEFDNRCAPLGENRGSVQSRREHQRNRAGKHAKTAQELAEVELAGLGRGGKLPAQSKACAQ